MIDRFEIASPSEVVHTDTPVDVCTIGQLARHIGVRMVDREAIQAWVDAHPDDINDMLAVSLNKCGYTRAGGQDASTRPNVGRIVEPRAAGDARVDVIHSPFLGGDSVSRPT